MSGQRILEKRPGMPVHNRGRLAGNLVSHRLRFLEGAYFNVLSSQLQGLLLPRKVSIVQHLNGTMLAYMAAALTLQEDPFSTKDYYYGQ